MNARVIDPLADAGARRAEEAVRRSPGVSPAALGLELRVGRVSRENAATRALRLLLEGRVIVRRVDDRGILARVRGDSGHVRTVVCEFDQWSCDCPAKGERCAHVMATQLVTIAPSSTSAHHSTGGTT
jgi:hypothetical protein